MFDSLQEAVTPGGHVNKGFVKRKGLHEQWPRIGFTPAVLRLLPVSSFKMIMNLAQLHIYSTRELAGWVEWRKYIPTRAPHLPLIRWRQGLYLLNADGFFPT